MKRTLSLLSTCALASQLTGCNMTAQPAEEPSLLPAEVPYEFTSRLHFRYKALPDSYTEDLRQACRLCASVEFELLALHGDEHFRLRLQRGVELDALLDELQTVPRWYARHTPGIQINHAGSPRISFYDAEGVERHRIDIWPEGGVHAREGMEYLSLWELCRRHFSNTPH